MVQDFVELLVAAAAELVGGPPNRPTGETTLPVQPTPFGWIRRELTRKTAIRLASPDERLRRKPPGAAALGADQHSDRAVSGLLTF